MSSNLTFLSLLGVTDDADVVSRPRKLSTVAPLNDDVIILRHVEAAKRKKSPSVGATPSGFVGTQAHEPILNGRPFATRATPVHIYHKVFTTFTSIYNDKTREIPPNIQKHVYDLCHASSQLYETTKTSTTKRKAGETKRVETVRPIYRMILDESIMSTRIDDCEPDGVITTKTVEGEMAL